MWNRNRTVWHNYERDIVNEMKKWYPDCKTSRYASRELDDMKVDIFGTGMYNIQTKYTKSMPVTKAQDILNAMPDYWWNIILHKLNKWAWWGKEETVMMTKTTFYEIVDFLHHNS